MAFADFSDHEKAVALLQRSLERGRLAHGYLFCGNKIEHLENVARTLAKTLNCERPVKKSENAIDCCDKCAACRRIHEANHPDVHWVRPESKSRVITIAQMRDMMQQIHLKPNEAEFKALYAYSPIHNVKPGTKYPATLITTADHDDRVVPAHNFKYAAALQAGQGGDNPILIRIDTKSGHGASSTTKTLEQQTDIFAFLFKNLGVTPKWQADSPTTTTGGKAF